MPYQLWHETDPAISGLLQAALVSYRHELMTSNFAGIPVLQQHGSLDDNVPTYHSRRMNQLTSESGQPSKYVELANKGHWFQGVMETEPLRQFYKDVLDTGRSKGHLPLKFNVVIPNTGDMGSRGGILVDQLSSPDQLGRIEVIRNETSSTWTIKTSNIFRFHFACEEWNGLRPIFITIDSSPVFTVQDGTVKSRQWFIQAPDGLWSVRNCPKTYCVYEADPARKRSTPLGNPRRSDTDASVDLSKHSSVHGASLYWRIPILLL